jgi:hypothetical protein
VAERVFRAHLKDKSGEFRRSSVMAASESEAVAVLERLEAKRAAFTLSPEEALELENKLKASGLSGRDKARLVTHQQSKPYRIVKVV